MAQIRWLDPYLPRLFIIFDDEGNVRVGIWISRLLCGLLHAGKVCLLTTVMVSAYIIKLLIYNSTRFMHRGCTSLTILFYWLTTSDVVVLCCICEYFFRHLFEVLKGNHQFKGRHKKNILNSPIWPSLKVRHERKIRGPKKLSWITEICCSPSRPWFTISCSSISVLRRLQIGIFLFLLLFLLPCMLGLTRELSVTTDFIPSFKTSWKYLGSWSCTCEPIWSRILLNAAGMNLQRVCLCYFTSITSGS